jgi:hypothetical protein
MSKPLIHFTICIQKTSSDLYNQIMQKSRLKSIREISYINQDLPYSMASGSRNLSRLLSENWAIKKKGYSGTSFEKLWHQELSRVFGLHYSATSSGQNAVLFEQVKVGGTDFDGLLSLSGALSCEDISASSIESIINFEYTIQTSESQTNYWLNNTDPKKSSNGKLIKFLKFLKTDSSGKTVEKRLEDIKDSSPKYGKLQVPKGLDKAYLIGFDRFGKERPSDWAMDISNWVKTFDPTEHKNYSFTPSKSGAMIIKTPDNHTVIFQLLDLGQMADLLATIDAIGGTEYDSTMALKKNQTLVNNGMNHLAYARILAELTKAASGEIDQVLLSQSPKIMIPLESVHAELDPATKTYNPKFSKMGGTNVETLRFEIKAEDLLMLTQVVRTVSKTGALQRIPDKSHMHSISVDLGKKMFVNPIVASTSQSVQIKRNSGNDFLEISGGTPVIPFNWDLIDGQHRVYANYYVPPGTNAAFEVVLYRYPSAIGDDLKDKTNSQIFYDLNYRTKPADPEIALVRSAYIDTWTGDWDDYDSVSLNTVYSTRVLASRFLIELAELKGVLKGIFNFRGLKSDESISLKSISTYFSDNFSFEARGRTSPGGHEQKSVLRVYEFLGIKSKGVSVAFRPNVEYPNAAKGSPIGPSPEYMAGIHFWEEATKDFNKFLDALDTNSNITKGRLREWTLGNSCIMPGIWQFYISYTISQTEIPTRNKGGKWASTILDTICKYLTSLDAKSYILGDKKAIPALKPKYSSSGGVVALRNDLIEGVNKAMKSATWVDIKYPKSK